MRLAFPLALMFAAIPAFAQPLPAVEADGPRVVETLSRKPVILKGVNLGNWLMIETWMFGGNLEGADQYQVNQILTERFGPEKAAELFETYRENYITPRDFEIIKSYGFNVVRLPFDSRMLQSEESPDAMRPDAFHFLDKCLEMAEAAGVYVILDMHGLPGGQSREHHTGRAGQNKLWGSDENYNRAATLWTAIADRYKDRSVVAAYDLYNEPYGNYAQDLKPDLQKLAKLLYGAVRKVDEKHLILFAGGLNTDIDFYGTPAQNNWKNVGYTEHYYAGLFGDAPALESHARTLNRDFPKKKAWLDQAKAPYLVGEFNVVNGFAGGGPLMRMYYDKMASYGWMATMWSYKLLSPEGGVGSNTWCVVSNAQPLAKYDIRGASFEQLKKQFEEFSTMPLAKNESLFEALTAKAPPRMALRQFKPVTPVKLPAASAELAGFASADIGGARAGATVAKDGVISVFSGGMDIFESADNFRFVSRPAKSDDALAASVLELNGPSQWSKAGLMARAGTAADAPFVMVNTFSGGGEVAFLYRASAGAKAVETKTGAGLMPVELKLELKGGKAIASFRRPGGEWTALGETAAPAALDRIGLAVTANDSSAFSLARFRLGDTQPQDLPAKPDAARVVKLRNAGFAQGSGDWNPQGTITPGDASLAIATEPTSLIWQDIPVHAGRRYKLTFDAARSDGAVGTLEAKLESTQGQEQLTLAATEFNCATMPTQGTRPVTVIATAPYDVLRVLIMAHGRDDQHAGSVQVSKIEVMEVVE